jgi:hypothetical protein
VRRAVAHHLQDHRGRNQESDIRNTQA